MIVLWWPTQNWFPLVIQVLIDHPMKLSATRKSLTIHYSRQKLHPPFPKLRLLAVLSSIKSSEQQNFQMRLKKSFMIYAEPKQKQDMKEFSKNGETIVYNEMKIPMLQILHGTQKNGCLYNGICASIFMSLMILCSLSSVFMIEGSDKLLSYPLVTEFVKGIFNRHPAIPKYANIWDIYVGPSLSF